jgi:transposase
LPLNEETRQNRIDMPQPFILPPLDAATSAELDRRCAARATADSDTRRRYEVVRQASRGRSTAALAREFHWSHDTVLRILQRFARGGLDTVPRRLAPGRPRTVTPAWRAALERAVAPDPDPPAPSRRWTAATLAQYLTTQTGIAVSAESVRLYLHAQGYVYRAGIWRRGEEALLAQGHR